MFTSGSTVGKPFGAYQDFFGFAECAGHQLNSESWKTFSKGTLKISTLVLYVFIQNGTGSSG